MWIKTTRKIRLKVVERIAHTWNIYRHFIVGDKCHSRPVLGVDQYQALLSKDGEYAGNAELQCISDLHPNYVFRVRGEVEGEAVIFYFGSGEEVCDLLFSGNLPVRT